MAWIAVVFVSLGQLSQFAAIHYIEISRVVMIASLEVFLAKLLSVYVLRSEVRLSLMTIIGFCNAVAGAIVIALS